MSTFILTGVSDKVWAELSINPLNVTVIFCAFATPVNSTVIVLPLKSGSSATLPMPLVTFAVPLIMELLKVTTMV